MLEINRPDRAQRHRAGNDDDQDAIAAARAGHSGRAAGVAKQRAAAIEAIRVLRMARTSAVKACTVALNQLKDLRVTAPAALRATLESLTPRRLAARAAAFAIPGDQTSALSDPSHATTLAMRRLGRRVAALTSEIAEVNTELDTLVAATDYTEAVTEPATPRSTASPSAACAITNPPATTSPDTPLNASPNA